MKHFKKIFSVILLVSVLVTSAFFTGCFVPPGDAVDNNGTGGNETGGTEIELLDPNEYFSQGFKFIYKPNTENNEETVIRLSEQIERMSLDLCYRLVNYYTTATAISLIDIAQLGYDIPQNDDLENWKSATQTTDSFKNTSLLTGTAKDWLIKGNSETILNNHYELALLLVGANANVLTDSTFISELDSLSNKTDKKEYYTAVSKKYLKNIDHYGLLNYQKDYFINSILNYFIGSECLALDSNAFTNNDGIAGFGAEMFFDGNGQYDEGEKFQDENGNDVLDLWTKQKFIDEELCTNETYNWNNFHYIRKKDGTTEYVIFGEKRDSEPEYSYKLNSKNNAGTSETILDIDGKYDYNEIFIDLNGNGLFDAWTKETFIAKNYCTEENYSWEKWHYTIEGNGTVEIVINGVRQTPTAEQMITIYGYDTRKTKFKNYQNIIEKIVFDMFNVEVETVSNQEPVLTKIYGPSALLSVQDLTANQFANNFEDLNGSMFNTNILTNTTSDYTLQSIVFMPSKNVVLQSIPFDIEYLNTENGAPNDIKINMTIRYNRYNPTSGTNQLFEKKVATFTVNNETYDVIKSPDYTVNFENIATSLGLEDGFKLSEFKNNCAVQTELGEHSNEAMSIADLSADAQNCFIVQDNLQGNGCLVQYADYLQTDFLELVFDAEKVNGVTPSFKLGITAFDFSDPEATN